jgi:hypothetical protein
VNLEEVLFDELFFGKRKMVHLYQLDGVRQFKYREDWGNTFSEKFNIEKLPFKAILNTCRFTIDMLQK